VLGGGRSLREVECFAESASRSFIDYLELRSIYLSAGNRTVVQTISKAFLTVSNESSGFGWFWGGSLQHETDHHILNMTSSRLRAAGVFHSGMRLVVDTRSCT
jgi:hypothetical protein